jgi:hypothetical protein
MLQHRQVQACIVTLLLVVLLLLVLLQRLSVAEPAQPTGWQVVGQIGGPTQAVAVQGDYAYVGVGLRLIVLDVTNPITPTEVGSTPPFPYFVEDIALSGTRAYVAAGGAGLRIVDISNPGNPTEVGAWDSPGYAEGVAVEGNIAYLADGPYGLRVVDVTDPAHPTPVGVAYDMNYALNVAVSGSYAYLAAAGAGLLVTDISDPVQPLEIGTLDTPGYAYGIAISGNLAYVADGWEGLRIVNISQPGDPGEVGACDTPGWALDVAVSGTLAYVADGANGLRLVDVSDPANPQELGAYESANPARRVAVAGSTAYVADPQQGLHLVDLAEPGQPARLGLYSPLTDAQYVAAMGGYAYVAAGFQGLRVIEVADPTHPHEAGAYDTGSGYANGVAVSGTYAYLAILMGGPVDLYVLDISDPTDPQQVAAFDLGWPTDWGPFRQMVLAEDILYVADEAGVGLIDVHEPAAPLALGHLTLDPERLMATTGLAVSGTLAYVAHASYGLKIVDVSDPLNPTLLSAYMPPGGCTAGAVAGSFLYTVNGTVGLHIVDVHNPAQPAGMGTIDTPGFSNNVVVAGDLAFVSDGGSGVQVVDVSDPASPSLVGSCDTVGFAWQSVLSGSTLYVADHQGGLAVLQEAGQPTPPHSSASGRQPSPGHSPAEAAGGSGLALPLAQAPGQGPWAAVEAWQQRLHAGARQGGNPGSSDAGMGGAAAGATRTVTTTADQGPGSLRWWLDHAADGDTITFDPTVFSPSHPATITLESGLPLVVQADLTIDASNAGVVLDGRLLPETEGGLSLDGDDDRVMGLQMVNFALVALSSNGRRNVIGGDRTVGTGPTGQGNAIHSGGFGLNLSGGASENVVEGNLIGTDVTGRLARPNWIGIAVNGRASHNTIGGTTPGRRNLISGNQTGVQFAFEGTEGNIIAGNYIGTDVTGTSALGNWWGVRIEVGATGTIVGSSSPEARNLISGNTEHGVLISDAGTAHNAIIGNWIGTDATGTRALGNQPGIGIYGCGFNRVGGTAPGEGNVIVSERGSGIDIAGATDVLVLGNLIGLAPDGTQVLGNGFGASLGVSARHSFVGGASAAEGNVISGGSIGLSLEQAGTEYNWLLGNRIGVDSSDDLPLGNFTDGIWVTEQAAHNLIQGNIIAHNGGVDPNRGGVTVSNAPANTLRRNSIHSNAGPGISLANGGNGMLPAPAILAVTETAVSGTACSGCTVEVFSDGEDEGRIYEGTTIADAVGVFVFDKSIPLTGPYLTATATDGQGNTSEFSTPVARTVQVYLPLILRSCASYIER